MQHSNEFNDIIMTLDELIAACGQDAQWVMALIEENVIEYDVPETQQFTGYQLATVRRASRLSRDFEASIPAIGLILELLDEVEQLRQFKKQWESQNSEQSVVEIKLDKD